MPRLRSTLVLLVLALGGCGGAEPVESDETNRDGECTFNRDCPADQRCECDESTGCACADGARGTGRNGVDTCETGEDCASSLCVEGAGGVFYCSDECETADDCEDALPQCLDVAFVGRICAPA